MKRCISNYFFTESIGIGFIIGGAPFIKKNKAAGAFGSTKYTSLFSILFGNRGKLGIRLPTFVGYFPPKLRLTRYLSRFITRWLPIVGWGLLGYDIYKIYKCEKRCEKYECQKPKIF